MKNSKRATFILSGTLIGGLALSGSAFAMQSLPQGYLLWAAAHDHAGDEEAAEANCQESKCGAGTEKDAPSKAELAFELCKIYGLDQGIRDPGLNSKAADVWPQIDALNFNRIVLFLENNGYPNEELLGKENMRHECVSAAFTAVLLHNPHRLVNEQRYFDLFLNEVKKGNLDADFYATILDKYYWTKSRNKVNRRVFYGSEFGKPCIQTKTATNESRVEIGLNPLEDSGFVDCGEEQMDMPKERK